MTDLHSLPTANASAAAAAAALPDPWLFLLQHSDPSAYRLHCLPAAAVSAVPACPKHSTSPWPVIVARMCSSSGRLAETWSTRPRMRTGTGDDSESAAAQVGLGPCTQPEGHQVVVRRLAVAFQEEAFLRRTSLSGPEAQQGDQEYLVRGLSPSSGAASQPGRLVVEVSCTCELCWPGARVVGCPGEGRLGRPSGRFGASDPRARCGPSPAVLVTFVLRFACLGPCCISQPLLQHQLCIGF